MKWQLKQGEIGGVKAKMDSPVKHLTKKYLILIVVKKCLNNLELSLTKIIKNAKMVLIDIVKVKTVKKTI